MVSLAQVVVFLSQQDGWIRLRIMLFVFLRPFGAVLLGYHTQGSASLHPGLRSYAASRLKGSQRTVSGLLGLAARRHVVQTGQDRIANHFMPLRVVVRAGINEKPWRIAMGSEYRD